MATELARVLAELGCTGEEVAVALKARGILGVRNTVRFLNPIIRYLQSRLRLDLTVLDLIPRDRVRYMGEHGRRQEVPLPHPVLVFLDAFHGGKYPDLELPPEQAS